MELISLLILLRYDTFFFRDPIFLVLYHGLVMAISLRSFSSTMTSPRL
jgi:hypothetical protein